jgi:hypothetical protein
VDSTRSSTRILLYFPIEILEELAFKSAIIVLSWVNVKWNEMKALYFTNCKDVFARMLHATIKKKGPGILKGLFPGIKYLVSTPTVF